MSNEKRNNRNFDLVSSGGGRRLDLSPWPSLLLSSVAMNQVGAMKSSAGQPGSSREQPVVVVPATCWPVRRLANFNDDADQPDGRYDRPSRLSVASICFQSSSPAGKLCGLVVVVVIVVVVAS